MNPTTPHPPPAPDTPGPPVVLLVTADADLREEIHRLAAGAGALVRDAADPAAALRSWSGARLVLVGADLAAALAATDPPARGDLHVVSSAVDPPFRAALSLGASAVHELPRAYESVTALLADAADPTTGAGGDWRTAPTIGVLGGSGGVGTSTLAAAIGLLAAADGEPVLGIDLDAWGGGLDRTLGIDTVPGLRWEGLGASRGRLGAVALRDAVPRRGALGVLAAAGGSADWPDLGLVREVLSAARRGHAAVVLDLPRSREPWLLETVGRCDLVVVVSGLTVPAAAATHRVVAEVAAYAPHVALVARGAGRGLRPEDLAAALALRLLGEVPDLRRLPELVDLGAGPLRRHRGPLAAAARAALDEVRRGTPATRRAG